MAYCTKDDLLTGDIPLAGKYGDGSSFVELAADEIDGQIGHIYVTPVTLPETTPEQTAKARPVKLLLKKINQLLASGRIVLDMAAGGEDDRLHAYGASMRNEALALINQIVSGKIVLAGVDLIEADETASNTAVSILNVDPVSLVEGYYDTLQSPFATLGSRFAPRIYDAETAHLDN